MDTTKKISQDDGKSRQFIAALIVNLLSFAGGINAGWPSPVIPQLQSNHPPVGNTPMNEDQISWIGGLFPMGGLMIVPFCGYLTELLGRKKFALINGLPFIAAWLFVIFAQCDIHLYAARLLMGCGGGMSIFIAPMYVSETASEDVRGAYGSFTCLATNFGILFAFVAGAYLSYGLFAWVSMFFSILFLVTFAPMPETPAFLLRRDRLVEARKSLMFFRGNNQALVDRELSALRCLVTDPDQTTRESLRLSEFLSDRATRKGLIISFILLGGQQLSGILAMLSYAETIFKRAGSSISSETAPIVIGVIQIVGSYASTMLMDRAGRRLLTLISCLGMALSHLLIGGFFNLQRNEQQHDLTTTISWLPLVAFSTYIAFYCLGIGPVPFVVTSEIFRPDISSSATTVCLVFYLSMAWVTVKAFGSGMDLVGLDFCFYALACLCVICLVLSYWLMPETKGRKREDIVDELAGVGRHRQDECL